MTSKSHEGELHVEEGKTDAKTKDRSPTTHSKLSYRASEYALIQYLSTLAKDRNTIKSFDFAFVGYLLENGADINNCDRTGQSAFHIVAKFWNIDVARFLLDSGADINSQDRLGRSPLHEASVLNYVDMVEFLLQNGADVNIRTFEQEQSPIHFAAKNDSCQTVRTLLAYGAGINSLDSKNRTPLQVAAEMSRANVSELLINEGASTVIFDLDGNSALTLLAEKLPDIAVMALDQLHSVDSVKRKEFFSLNYLEGTRVNSGRETVARTLLEIAVRNNGYFIVMHPVVQQLIDVKWNDYGKWGAVWDLMVNLFYVMLWTILSFVLSCKSSEIYLPISENGWKIGVILAIVIITGAEIRKNVNDTLLLRQQQKDWIEWKAQALKGDLAFSHPRCTEEWKYLSDEVKSVRSHSYLSLGGGWIYIDWLALLLVFSTILSHIVFLAHNTINAYKVHTGIFIALLLVLWVRIVKYARPFQSTGPIVVIFSHIIADIVKCSFLFAVLFIPYTSAFWVTYGLNSPKPVEGYSNIYSLLYNMFCMVVGIDFPFDDLLLVNPFMARTLCSSFIISTAIVVVNLLIALLSDTFTRLYSNAVANAVMQRAQSIVTFDRTLSKKRKRDYFRYIREHCSPLVKPMDHETQADSKTASTNQITNEMKKIATAIGKLLGKSSPVKNESGNATDPESIKYTVNQLLKQSQENAAKIEKILKHLIGLKKKARQPQPSWRNLFSTRRGRVISTVSETQEVADCQTVDVFIPEDSNKNVEMVLESSEALGATPITIPNVVDLNFRQPKLKKKTRFLSIGEDNRAHDDSDEEQPHSSHWNNQEIQRLRHNRSEIITFRSSSLVPYTSPNFPGLSQRFLELERKDSSSDGSISL